MFGVLAASSLADEGPDDAKICVGGELGDCTTDDVNAWLETDAGVGDEARLLGLKRRLSRSRTLNFTGGIGDPLILDDLRQI